MANVTYVVKKGDTLSAIAAKYGTTVSTLVSLNKLANANFIKAGQTLIISGTAKAAVKNTGSLVKVTDFGAMASNSGVIFAVWAWDKDHTDRYDMRWEYGTGDGYWWKDYDGSDYKTTSNKQYLYSIPSNAKKVRFSIRAVAKKYTKNKKEYPYFTTTDWSSWETYTVPAASIEKPDTPSAPALSMKKYKLTVELDNLPSKIVRVKFEIVKNDNKRFALQEVDVTRNHASYTITVDSGPEYKARCKIGRSSGLTPSATSSGSKDPYIWSDWSEYSDTITSIPPASSGIFWIQATSATSVWIQWNKVTNAKSYDIEYTTNVEYFDTSSEVSSTSVDAKQNKANITGMESGKTYYFRVRAVNDQGESGWTKPVSVTIGTKPAEPTTWMSTSTVIVGEPLNLYWVHNSEDGSSQRRAELQITVNGSTQTITVENDYNNEETKDNTSVYTLDTSQYREGAKITWRVRTMGVLSTYSDWSVDRTIDIYAPPTVDLQFLDSTGVEIDILKWLPFYVIAMGRPYTQTPTGYFVSITAGEAYETVDNVGNVEYVGAGDEIFSQYYNSSGIINVPFTAADIRLANNITYKLRVKVAMSSGLTAEATRQFEVAWETESYSPMASVVIDEDNLTATIVPFCEDENGNLIPDVMLSVYRREFDGKFVEIMSNVPNTRSSYFTDPHPALDYARYRVIATNTATGAMSYTDLAGVPVGDVAAVLQWDETWTALDITEDSAAVEDETTQNLWTGTMLRLPYNLDITDTSNPDAELVEYIGRSNPVSYYGTQIGSTSSWSMEVPATDTETLYKLRRLMCWMGDVYVREPSGSGYWANVKVSFSQRHKEVTIPVTLSISRVEGGM